MARMFPSHSAAICLIAAVTLFQSGSAFAQSTEKDSETGLALSNTDDDREGINLSPNLAYDVSGAPRPAQLSTIGPVRVWQTFFAGRSSITGDPATGTQNVVASVAGTAFGADTQLDKDLLMGASLGLSHQTFSSGSSHGNSNDLTVTLYANQNFLENAYISSAVGYGWHDILTSRAAVTSGSDALFGKYRAQDFGGRIEGGYRFVLDADRVVSPYGAFVGDGYNQPAYNETAQSGMAAFAASFAAKSTAITHLELGSRYGQYFNLDDQWALSIDALAAWEHELDDNPYVLASFQAVPGSNFIIPGTRPAGDTALLGLGMRLQTQNGFTFGARTDARLGVGTTIVSGTLDLTYRW